MVLDMTTSREGPEIRLALGGELDIAEGPRVERELRALEQERPERLVLDLSGLRFMDSTGLRLIVSSHQRLAADGRRLHIVPGPAQIQRIFRITRLDDRLHFVEVPADR